MPKSSAEKLLMLAIGAHFLDAVGRRPSIKDMKAFDHNLVHLQPPALEVTN